MSKKQENTNDGIFFSETKRVQINESLSKQIGLIVPGKNGFLLFLSSDSGIQIILEAGKSRNLFILGLAGSTAEKRKLEVMLGNFEGRFRVLFSQRDLNILVVHDFISELLKNFFFTRSSEEPMAAEFILAEVSKEFGVSVCSISFDGRSEFWKLDDKIKIIGCADASARSNIILGLKKINSGELEIEKLKEQVAGVLKNNGFDNNYVTIELLVK